MKHTPLDQLPGADTIEHRARRDLEAEISKSPEDATVDVRLWDDEWEQWHIDSTPSTDPTIELPLRAARAYAYAQAVWHEAQAVLGAAVRELEETFPEEARDHGWHHELFRGEITRAELDARLEPCPHPEESLKINEREPTEDRPGWRSVRCQRCAQYLEMGYTDERP